MSRVEITGNDPRLESNPLLVVEADQYLSLGDDLMGKKRGSGPEVYQVDGLARCGSEFGGQPIEVSGRRLSREQHTDIDVARWPLPVIWLSIRRDTLNEHPSARA